MGDFMDDSVATVSVTNPNRPVQLNCSVSSSTPAATARWMVKSEEGLINFIEENHLQAVDDRGRMQLNVFFKV